MTAVESFRFLGSTISQDLKWDIHIDSIVKKTQQRLYFLRKLLLFIMYTNDCWSMYENSYIIKYADDSVIVSLLHEQDLGHGPVVEDFISWCDRFSLKLNVNKTKDMVIDYRRFSPSPWITTIKGLDIEIVDTQILGGSYR